MLSLALLLAACAEAPAEAPAEALAEALPPFSAREEDLAAAAEALTAELSVSGPADPALVRDALDAHVAARLSRWVEHGIHADEVRIRDQAVRWEAFRLGRYVSSGVFPKTYFGFFDEQGDTAAAERTLRETTGCARREANAWLAERGDPLRVTDAEIAVTFVAEGGALLLTTDQERMDRLHPVHDVGLNDLASGASEHAGLLERLDAACGTALAGTVAHAAPGEQPAGAIDRLAAAPGQDAWLLRPATFREGVVGTALMWVWEKQIAARRLLAEDRAPLAERPLDEQFVIGSLVYNSGILHSEASTRSLLRFETGERLYDDSEKNAHRRPRLNLLPPASLLAELLSGAPLREQPTSWIAVYHVLQRYGAWEGLRRFSAVFDDEGAFSARTGP